MGVQVSRITVFKGCNPFPFPGRKDRQAWPRARKIMGLGWLGEHLRDYTDEISVVCMVSE